jgi:hypothetical protein
MKCDLVIGGCYLPGHGEGRRRRGNALPLGGYGACQVGGISSDGWVTVCTLDWYSEVMPTLDDLASVGPLILTHHNMLYPNVQSA